MKVMAHVLSGLMGLLCAVLTFWVPCPWWLVAALWMYFAVDQFCQALDTEPRG